MKAAVVLTAACLMAGSALAGPAGYRAESLFVPGDFSLGGFGAPVIRVSEVQDDWALFIGGRGGAIINHAFVIGGGGYVCTEAVNQDITEVTTGEAPDLVMMYGGLEAEYIAFSHKLVHFTAQVLVGGGALAEEEDRAALTYHDEVFDGFFVAEPGVNVELNILPFFRVAAGAGYRYVDGVELEGIGNGDLTGVTYSLQFKFGYF
jgi:hypothetical protein